MRTEAKQENWNQVADYAEQTLEEAGCSMKDRMRIVTAMEEIFVNVALYAYPGSGGEVDVSVTEQKDSILVVFEDSGVAYNPLKKPDPDVTLSAEAREIGGLGIYMAKKLMDYLEYEYRDGRNRLTMVKYKTNQGGGATL